MQTQTPKGFGALNPLMLKDLALFAAIASVDPKLDQSEALFQNLFYFDSGVYLRLMDKGLIEQTEDYVLLRSCTNDETTAAALSLSSYKFIEAHHDKPALKVKLTMKGLAFATFLAELEMPEEVISYKVAGNPVILPQNPEADIS